jgi:DNA-binding MarR family transcriptional regulator
VVVTGSDKGKRLHNAARQHQLTIAYRMLAPLSSGEREILLELMAKLIRAWREPQV